MKEIFMIVSLKKVTELKLLKIMK